MSDLKLLYNADLITMKDKDYHATSQDAVLIKDGYIQAIGKTQDFDGLSHPTDTRSFQRINLHGQTLMPGFIDAHSHFLLNGLTRHIFIDLSSPPVGSLKTLKQVLDKLKKAFQEDTSKDPLIGACYDDTLLEEKRPPSRQELDAISPDRPIILFHASFHAIVANSMAIAIAETKGYDWTSPETAPRDSSGQLTGRFYELKAMLPFFNAFLDFSKLIVPAITASTKEYTSQGVICAQEGATLPIMFKYLLEASNNGHLYFPIKILPLGDQPLDIYGRAISGDYLDDRKFISMGPVKFIADGSVQAYTAYLREAYYKPHPSMPMEPGYHGYPNYDRDHLCENILHMHKLGHQIAVHANGDAAIDDVLIAFAKAQALSPRNDARHIIVHCQSVHEDQLDDIKSLNLMPTFYASHVYYHGDRHKNLFLGPKRAAQIHPCMSAMKRGLIFSNHNDSPATPINPLMSLWSAVNRKTSSGDLLGPDQRIPVYEALKSLTSYAAYQYFDENKKGTIQVGKRADLIVLNKNPLSIDPENLRDLSILATWLNGNHVYGEFMPSL